MAVNNTNTPDSSTADTPMFAPIPSWERNRKRRAFGGAHRTAAPAPAVENRPPTGRLDAVETADLLAADPTFAGLSPSVGSTKARARATIAPLAIAAGIIALGGLAAAGWYANQPHEQGVAQLTPGSTSVTTTTTGAPPKAAASNDAAAAPAETAAVSPPQGATTTTRTTRFSTADRLARTRPAAARSVGDAGANASTTLPDGPQPFSGTATSPALISPSPAPVQDAPAPEPVEAAPAPVVATPPMTAPDTTALNPPATDTTTPPQ